jgi:cell division protein FtsI/penicillin-binding protein 2
MSSDRRQNDDHTNISAKANRVLNIVLVALLLIVLRIWHLAVVQYDEKLEESRKPQRRIVMESPKRGTIRDRLNIPLAINKIQYNVAILYSQIKQIPAVAWEVDLQGKSFKRSKRKEYIAELSKRLSQEIGLEAERIEDLIYAKAAFYNQIPFVLKEDITEEEYYRLKMMERDWAGIAVQIVPKRHYPKGKTAADIVGYMGAINRQEYEGIIREIKSLEAYAQSVDSGELVPPVMEGMLTSDQIFRRLKDLHEQAYSVNDCIGKGGIEGRYEGILKGFRGKKSYYSDAKGNFLRELPGTREPVSGKRLLLTISSELQEYAEKLLIQNEKIRQTRLSHLGPVKKTIVASKEPWIKGGAIVAIDPNNGEILAMASHPRFDPNDFVFSGDSEEAKKRKKNIQKWLENETYLAEVWDQIRPMDREVYDASKDSIYHEELFLTWESYLDLVLGKDSVLREGVLSYGTVQDAVIIQNQADKLLGLFAKGDAYALFNFLYQSDQHQPHGKQLPIRDREEMENHLRAFYEELEECKDILDPYIGSLESTYDQVLLVDLMRVAVPAYSFSENLLEAVGGQSLSCYRDCSAAMVAIENVVKKMSKELFHDLDFKEWRKSNEKAFLKQKRAEEKALHIYARPYIDYLDALEAVQFQEFWQTYREALLLAFLNGKYRVSSGDSADYYQKYFCDWHREIEAGAHQEIEWAKPYKILKKGIEGLSDSLVMEYFHTLRGFQSLDRPLLGRYRHLRQGKDKRQLEKHLAAAFYPKYGYGFGRSQAYRQAATQGSIFKLITAYEGLAQRYKKQMEAGQEHGDLNPLEIVDQVYYKGKDLFVGYSADGNPLPRHYKGGRLPRSIMTKIGKLDVVKALEMSSNPYFSILAGDVLESPEDLANAARLFSYGSRTGLDLPGEIEGIIPTDLEHNRTGLYSFAIGQHTLVVTPLQTSIMLSALANGGKVFKPKIVEMQVGKEPQRGRELAAGYRHFPYEESLGMVGIDFPLFVAADAEKQLSLIKRVPAEVVRTIFLPEEIKKILIEGMCRVVVRSHGESISSISRLYRKCPSAISDYVELKHQLIGKTSTAESIENIDLDRIEGTNIYTHVWFGGIAYDSNVVDEKHHRFIFQDTAGKPELVVVVYLRYGGYGKEAAPIAAQVAKKWKEIKEKNKFSGTNFTL